MSITMTQMLESITDAISAMVIFAQEAGNNQAVMKNLAQGATVRLIHFLTLLTFFRALLAPYNTS